MKEHGRILEVNITSLGSELTTAAADGATLIVVEDAVDFDEDGGQALINGQVVTYSTVDDDTGEITLTTPLTDAAEEGDRVDVYDSLYQLVSTEMLAQVKVDGEDNDADPIEATVAHHLTNMLDEGIRGGIGESVLLELDGDEWRVVDVLGLADSAAMKFWQDTFTLDTGGAQELTLTFLPIVNSEHVYWNGLYQRQTTSWTRAEQIITLVGDEALEGDVIDVEYAYLEGAIATDATSPPLVERYYFPSDDPGASMPVEPPYSTFWDITDEVNYTYRAALQPTPGTTDLDPLIMPETIVFPTTLLRGQFIRQDPLPAGEIAGSFQMVMVIGTSDASALSGLAAYIFVCSADGATVRGVLFDGTTGIGGPIAGTSATTRTLEGDLLPVTAQAGDLLVVEVGAVHNETSATLRYSAVTVGEGGSGVDHEFLNGEGVGLRPWIEFTFELEGE